MDFNSWTPAEPVTLAEATAILAAVNGGVWSAENLYGMDGMGYEKVFPLAFHSIALTADALAALSSSAAAAAGSAEASAGAAAGAAGDAAGARSDAQAAAGVALAEANRARDEADRAAGLVADLEGGPVASVNGLPGPYVVLTAADIGAATRAHIHAYSFA